MSSNLLIYKHDLYERRIEIIINFVTGNPAMCVFGFDYLRTYKSLTGAVSYCGVQACFEELQLEVGSLKQ